MSSFLKWLGQPSTILGLSTIAAAATGILTGGLTLSVALPIIAGGLVSAGLPQSQTATSVEAIVAQTIAAIAQPKV
jgi:hypothetical protein